MNRLLHSKNRIIEHYSSTTIQPFMARVYGWMTCGLCLTSFVSWFAFNNNITYNIFYAHRSIGFSLLLVQLLLVFVISGMLNRLNVKVITSLFMLYSLLNGLTLSSIFLAYKISSIFSVFCSAAGMFGVMTFYGYITKKDLSSLGNWLFMLLIGIILASVINIFLDNSKLIFIISYIGIILFLGLIIYDTQKLKQLGSQLNTCDNEIINKNAILGALSLYINLMNVFLFLLRLVGIRR